MGSNRSKFFLIMIILAFSLKIPVPADVCATGRDKIQVNSEGEPFHVPPSDGRPISSAFLPPLLGQGMYPRPATEGAYPLGSPDERLPVASHRAYSPLVKIGACDWTLGKGGDPAAFELAAKLGLDGIQVSLNPLDDSLVLLQPERQKSYRDASARTGVEIASFAIGELNNVPLKSDPRAERWVAEGIEIAAAMKVRIILVPFFGKGDLKGDPVGTEAVIAAIKRLAPKAERAGVILALESWLSAEDHLAIIEKVGSPAVQVYYDVGNSQEAGYDIFKEIRLLSKHICQFHAKDYKDLYGKGSMDFPAVRAAIEDIGYSGWLVMEGTQLPLGVEQSILYDLNYLRSLFPPGST